MAETLIFSLTPPRSSLGKGLRKLKFELIAQKWDLLTGATTPPRFELS